MSSCRASSQTTIARTRGRRSPILIGMAWEWVPPVAAASAGAIVGMAGIFATYRSGARQTKVAMDIARLQIEAQLQQLREDGRLRRQEAGYLELLTSLREIHDWAESVFSEKGSGRYALEDPPKVADAARRDAVVSAAWSIQIRSLMSEWNTQVDDFYRVARRLDGLSRDDSDLKDLGLSLKDIRKRLNEMRSQLFDTELRLRDQIWWELNSSSAP